MTDEHRPAARKAAIREVLGRLAEVAASAGLESCAHDIRQVRIPKLEQGRFSMVVLGEFNHGKSTFINALLALGDPWSVGSPAQPAAEPLLPVGITPTSAVLALIRHGETLAAEAVFEDGRRQAIEPAKLADWLTVAGAQAGNESLSHVEIEHPAPFLREQITVVDTPGVNDINEQRADITYGYVPRADAALFLLDATQILTASERRFIEERILRSCRDRMVFVVSKADLLDEAELDEATQFARRHLSGLVNAPAVFPVSAKRALAGDLAGSRLQPLLAHLRLTLGAERVRLLLDHALQDASRLAAFVRDSLGMRRRSLELPPEDLAARVAHAQERLKEGRRALDQAASGIVAEAAALKARVRQDLADFARDFAAALPPEIDGAEAADVRRYLGPFLQDTWKAWLEGEGERMAAELDRLAEQAIEVANQRVEGLTRAIAEELSSPEARLHIAVDTFKYDASVFALGALGTTIFLFINTLAGGLMTLAAPVLALILRGKVAQEVKAEASRAAPEAVTKAAAALAPKLDEIVDEFVQRLQEFIAEAGAALARGIAEVLESALAERRSHAESLAGSVEALDQSLLALKGIEERIAEIRQAVWDEGDL
jgi:GTPase Era involved in 16S rRNA processing/polyhydroxyalkanoate synthesis regulator phasin